MHAAALSARAQPPRLVVVIVVDQMRADYLDRFRDDLVYGGFDALLERGAVFANCEYQSSATETAPGHTVLSTGAYARENGIVSNSWYDARRGKVTTAVADDQHPLVGGPRGNMPGASPWALQASTIGDELRLARDGSRVISLSWKDRAAVPMGGKNPTAAFWFDAQTGGFVTSTYYMTALPDWLAQFNKDHGVQQYAGREWEPLEPNSAQTFSQKMPSPAENGGGERFWTAVSATPFAIETEFALAQAAVQEYNLGADENTDMLWISISATDYFGHQAGPDSPLLRDMYRRLDRDLGEFLHFLDGRVGLDNIVIALSADHGVAPVPEHATEERLGGGHIDSRQVSERINHVLVQQFGAENWVASYIFPLVFLNHDAIRKKNLDPNKVAKAAGEAALEIPGIAAYYTAQELSSPGFADPMMTLYANAFYPGRGGDVVLRYAPFFIPDSNGGTTHASPYTYDRRVPLILLGPNIRSGLYYSPASPADLAPTLAAILSINPPPMATGRILGEALLPPGTLLPSSGSMAPPRLRRRSGTEQPQ